MNGRKVGEIRRGKAEGISGEKVGEVRGMSGGELENVK